MLDAKPDEELVEYQKNQTIQELSDLIKVIYAAATARGSTRDQLEQIRTTNATQRGFFVKRIPLKS